MQPAPPTTPQPKGSIHQNPQSRRVSKCTNLPSVSFCSSPASTSLLTKRCQPRTWILCRKAHPEQVSGYPGMPNTQYGRWPANKDSLWHGLCLVSLLFCIPHDEGDGSQLSQSKDEACGAAGINPVRGSSYPRPQIQLKHLSTIRV